MKELPKAYEPKKYEDGIYKHWEDSGFFNPDVCIEKGIAKKKANTFSIVLPPPNVTGTLHMGHAAMLAIEDVMVRYHRMRGDRTLWVPGTDHAAIATQTKVEKLVFEKEGKTRHDLGREKFLDRVNKFAQESHDTIVNQSKKMGASLDWSREAFTLDEKRNLAVRTVFKKMYDDGLIYRGNRIVNWCPRCHSTLADDEVEYKEENGKFYWIKYGPFVLATARPETKLGDTAVAVHPSDKRYKKMVGKKYQIPGVLGEFEVEVVADEAVDPEFGTGAVKVTPAHSFTDNEIAKRHNLPLKKIIGEDGRMMDNCGKYAGMTTKEAREAIVKDMEKMGLIDHIEENYKHNLSICYRCGTTIEPLPSLQWFVDVNKKFKIEKSKLKGIKSGQKVSLKELMQKVVKNGEIKIIPDRFEKTYFYWIDNLRDWCISRQIWYGHQIPVWYKDDEIYVGVEKPKEKGWKQDEDTLDTWFSSGLWTLSTLGWPEKTKDLADFHPTSVLETGYDILFFWVARMILMTTYVQGEIPFEKVYLHGLVRDEKGRKMSKTLGNTIDPLDMIAKYGTDATRLSLLVGSTPGNDMKLSEAKVEGFRNFANKLWNISRFVLLNIDVPVVDPLLPKELNHEDLWILDELQKDLASVTANLDLYNFSLAGEVLQDFTWNKLADIYLEDSKVHGSNQVVLNFVLNTVLKLWHPFMPFVTEEIWHQVYGEEKMLLIQSWPLPFLLDKDIKSFDYQNRLNAYILYRWLVLDIRQIKNNYDIAKAEKISIVMSSEYPDISIFKENIAFTAGVVEVEFVDSFKNEKNYPKVVKKGVTVYLHIERNLAKEKARLQKEIDKVAPYTASLENKLNNKNFVAGAPKEVVEVEKKKLSEAKEKLEKLEQQLKSLN